MLVTAHIHAAGQVLNPNKQENIFSGVLQSAQAYWIFGSRQLGVVVCQVHSAGQLANHKPHAKIFSGVLQSTI